MNQLSVAMKPSTLGKEVYSVGLELRKVWKQHAFLETFVTFQYKMSGTNVQWVFAVQDEEDRKRFDGVPTHFAMGDDKGAVQIARQSAKLLVMSFHIIFGN